MAGDSRRNALALAPAVLLLGVLCAPVAAGGETGPTDLKAFYRQGQTFITWREDPAVAGEWYKVYSSEKPIVDVKAARFEAKIPEGSRNYRWAKTASPKLRSSAFRGAPHAAKCFDGIQLEDDESTGKILPEGTGVFVATVKEPGSRYYAVTLEKDGDQSAAMVAGVNSLKAPVEERVAPPGAILVGKTLPDGYVYLFFTDFRKWNPDGIDDNWEGYAHLCHVTVPAEADGARAFPLAVRLHAYSAWQDWLAIARKGAVGLALLDYNLTWWYGYSDAKPKMEGPSPHSRVPVRGVVHNFTEQRVLQAVSWLLSGPANCRARVDPERVSVWGGSMGGSGVHVLGLRHGEVFAAGRATVGITDWALEQKYQGWSLARHVGPQSRNDMTNESVPVYEALNLPKWLGDHPEIETPYLDTSHGIIDGVIAFHSVPDFCAGLERGKHAYAAGWEMAGHSGTVATGSPMNPTLVRRDESLPAFADASTNTPLNSGLRFMGTCEKIEARSITLKAGSLKICPYSSDGRLPPDLAGKTLVLGPNDKVRKWWRIASSTPTGITVEEGDLTAYLPPVTGWQIHVFKQQNKRDPSPEDLAAIAGEKKKVFLVCDGQPRGQRNAFFAWSSSTQNFDPARKEDDIVDEERRYAICIRLQKNGCFGEPEKETATADVTPRRCRKFRPKPGARVSWENLSCADPEKPEKIAGGEVTVDEHGLVTVPKFVIGSKGWGNRLVLTVKGE